MLFTSEVTVGAGGNIDHGHHVTPFLFKFGVVCGYVFQIYSFAELEFRYETSSRIYLKQTP